jgi:hypothetical protein
MKAEQEANATRAVNPCVLCGGKGFARNGEIKMSFNKVVQYHRRLRHIAPGSFFGKLIGAGRNSRETATNPLAPRGPQPNWTAAKRAFPAAWLPLIFAAGIAVAPSEVGGTE